MITKLKTVNGIENSFLFIYDLSGLLFLLRSRTHLKYKAILSKEVINALLTFPTTCLCGVGFSALFVIKSKYKNNLDPEHNNMQCALSVNIHDSSQC